MAYLSSATNPPRVASDVFVAAAWLALLLLMRDAPNDIKAAAASTTITNLVFIVISLIV